MFWKGGRPPGSRVRGPGAYIQLLSGGTQFADFARSGHFTARKSRMTKGSWHLNRERSARPWNGEWGHRPRLCWRSAEANCLCTGAGHNVLIFSKHSPSELGTTSSSAVHNFRPRACRERRRRTSEVGAAFEISSPPSQIGRSARCGKHDRAKNSANVLFYSLRKSDKMRSIRKQT